MADARLDMSSKYDALVEIRVPKKDGEEAIGTGYPVAKDRILTARHVVRPADRNEKKPIEVRWYYGKGVARKFRAINDIVWEGPKHGRTPTGDLAEDIDVALLDCEFPGNAPSFISLTPIKPWAHAQWDSKGFARVAKTREEEREPVGLQGSMHEMATTALRFEVDVYLAPEVEKGWAGGSGCPVFVGDNILGVVVSTYGGFGQAKLEAIAIWRLLEEFEDFRRKVGYSAEVEREKRLEPYRDKITHEIRQTQAARICLQEIGKVVPIGDGDIAEQVARALLQLAHVEASSILSTVFDANAENDVAVAGAISRIANLVLPALFDDQETNAIRAAKGNEAGGAVPVRCHTATVAELIMAKSDGREAQYRPFCKDVELRGRHDIYVEPEGGRKHDAASAIQNIDNMLRGCFLRADETEKYSAEEIKYLIKKRLVVATKTLTKYLTCRPVDISKDPQIMSIIGEIKKSYPEIMFLKLCTPTECDGRDDDLLYDDDNKKHKLLSFVSE